MQKSSAPNASFDSDAPGGPAAGTGEPIAGDADAVQRTTYVVGKGTDDRARRSPAPNDRDDATTEPDDAATGYGSETPPRRGTGPDDATTGA